MTEDQSLRRRLAAFDRDVFEAGAERSDRTGATRYVRYADTLLLSLRAGAVLAVVLTALELAVVRRPEGTVAYLVVGLLLGAVVGVGTARAQTRELRDVPEVQSPDVVPHRTPPRVLAVLAVVAVVLVAVPLVLSFPTPVGPFAAAVGLQAFLHRRAVHALEAERGGRLLAPAASRALHEEALRWELRSPTPPTA